MTYKDGTMDHFEVGEDGLLSETPITDLASWYSQHCPQTPHLAFEAQFMLMRTYMSLKLDSPFELRGGITRARYNVLRMLAQSPEQRLQMTDIVTGMNVSPTNITKLVDVLVEDNYVRRAPDPLDKRKFWVELMPEGKRIFEEIVPDVGDHVRAFWTGISEQEMRTLVHLLSRIRLNSMTADSFAQHARSLVTPPVMVSGAVAREPISTY
jgi:DNA-binding MarR family transcriptional regulator